MRSLGEEWAMRCLRWTIAVTTALMWGTGSAEPADAQLWIRVDGTWMRSPGPEPRQWVRDDGPRYGRDGFDDREDRYDEWEEDQEDRYDAWYDDREDRYDHREAGREARDDREDAWEDEWEEREQWYEEREQWYEERDEWYEHSHEYREWGRDGHWEDGYATSRERRPALRSSLLSRVGVPPGHRPPPGLCRVWFPGVPPGRQPAPEACQPLFWYGVPPGAVVVGPAGEGGPPPGQPGRGRGRGPPR
jgi:hypothetical protein